MKKELFKTKLKRTIWALLCFFVIMAPAFGTITIIEVAFHIKADENFGGWFDFIMFLIMWGVLHAMLKRPIQRFEAIFLTPKLEDYDQYITTINDRLRETRLNKLQEREAVLQSKIEIMEEIQSFNYSVSNTSLLRLTSDRLNDIHANEPNNKLVIDARDVEISKKEFKKYKKEVLVGLKKVSVSRINAEKLKDIEEILTGKQAKEQQKIMEEHQRQLELAQASAAKTVIQNTPQSLIEDAHPRIAAQIEEINYE